MKLLLRETTEKTKIKSLFDKLEITDEEHAALSLPFELKVKTPFGWNNIKTAFRTQKQETVTTYFGNGKTLKTSPKHRVKSNGDWIHVKDLKINQLVECESGYTKVCEQKAGKDEILYDISVEDVHCYYSNGILSHNSWVLAKLGAEAMKQGKHVVHFTLELGQEYVGRRYDCNLTNIDFQSITHPENRQKIVSEIKKVRDIGGWLKIKYYPIKTVSATTLKNYIERIQTLTGEKVDLVIVDYADILRPTHAEKNSNSYSEAGGIYEELRGVAGELQIPCWTASQSNRAAANEDIIEAGSISDSYRKIMTADFVLSLSRKTEDKLKNTARFHVIKNRFGPDGITYNATFDASCGGIDLYDTTSEKGKSLQRKMSDGEQDVKSFLNDKWQKMSNNKNSNESDLG